jgi:hypothetical protein
MQRETIVMDPQRVHRTTSDYAKGRGSGNAALPTGSEASGESCAARSGTRAAHMS